jgi:MFS family permease
VLAGGLVGGIVGPTVSKWTKDALPTAFLGAYLTLIVFLCVVLVVIRLLDIPAPTEAEAKESGRPLAAIVAQPAFVVAVVAAAFGYGVMNLLMTATPLAMGICGHPYSAAATVISWHVIGMFAPSFFTGSLIKRFGVLNVMLAGVVLNFVCIGIALAGIDVANFWGALFLLGVGWNFLYIGATALLTETYRPAEKAKAQGANDMFIFLTMATSSFSSGMLLEANGWQLLNYLAIPFIAAIGIALLWLMTKRRVPAVA